jgi:hypothetical protein
MPLRVQIKSLSKWFSYFYSITSSYIKIYFPEHMNYSAGVAVGEKFPMAFLGFCAVFGGKLKFIKCVNENKVHILTGPSSVEGPFGPPD